MMKRLMKAVLFDMALNEEGVMLCRIKRTVFSETRSFKKLHNDEISRRTNSGESYYYSV
jgi:hypothetical protein